MTNQNLDSQTLLQSVLWGRRHGAFRSHRGQALERAVFLGQNDKIIRELVDLELAELRKLHATGQLPPFGTARSNAGELQLGQDYYGTPIRLPLRALASGTMVLGSSGAGKTNFLKFVLPQIAAAGVPVWMTESYKTELRHLRHLI